MTFDELQKTWHSQQADPNLAIEPGLLLKEVKRNKEQFDSAIFWRDFREVGVAVVLVVFFLCFGIKHSLWPLYLLALVCLWVAAFIVVDRIVQKRRRPCLSDSLFNCVKSSLAQINHQVWLLRNVLWWYLAPPGVGLIIWFGYCGISIMTSENPHTGYLLFSLGNIVGTILLYWGVYWLNQWTIRKELAPRKNELEDLLNSFKSADV
ncbi:MAG: hypothetical protein KAS75_05010 [Planctomycetes bacterium]|nr:hypothetical protein [Planctomycetota bacterium]